MAHTNTVSHAATRRVQRPDPVRIYAHVEEIPVYPNDRPLEEGETRRPFYGPDDGWLRLIGRDVLVGDITVFAPSEPTMDAVMLRVYHGYTKSKLNQESYIGALVGQIRDDLITRSTRHLGHTRKDCDRRAPRPVRVHTGQHIRHFASTIRTTPDGADEIELDRHDD